MWRRFLHYITPDPLTDVFCATAQTLYSMCIHVCQEDVQRRGVLFTSFIIERSDISLSGARLNWNSTQRE